MDFLENYIEDINSSNFMEKVIKESSKLGIIVDFWAPWCQPCKQITPILEKLTNQFQGKLKLCKVNIDENQQLAQQLNIQSVPTIMAFFEGQPINGFAGMKNPQEIEAFFQEVVSASSISSDAVDDLNQKLDLAESLLEKKDIDMAMQQFSELISNELPKKEMSRAISGLGKCLLESNKIAELEDLLSQLEESLREEIEIKELIKAKEFFAKIVSLVSQDRNTDKKSISNLENKLEIARNSILKRNYEEATENYLFIINKNNLYKEGIAKKELLSLFSFLGNNNSTTISGRSKLLNMLYK